MSTPHAESQTAPAQLHACFALAGHQRLNLPSGLNPLQAWYYLSHQVQRAPQNLADHTRRILLCVHPSLRNNLPGALADLYQILGDRGKALRQHMLRVASVGLSEKGQAFFTRWIESGACPVRPAPRFAGAVIADAGANVPGLMCAGDTTLQACINEAQDALQSELALAKTRDARRTLSHAPHDIPALAVLHALAKQGGERSAVRRYRQRLLSPPEAWS